jgi:hypothetical protein
MTVRELILMGIALFYSTACSLIADPDQFKYKEGSASDNNDSLDTVSDSQTETETETEQETGFDTSSDSVSNADTGPDSDSADSPNVGAVCENNDDCTGGAICPMLFNTSNEEESESYCYLNCDDSADVCSETINPLCYQHVTGAVCLEKATLRGSFSCRATMTTDTSQIDVRIRPDDETVRLEQCEMYSSDGGFGFIFSTVTNDGILEATLFIPDVNLGDLQGGMFDTAHGEIRLNILDTEYQLTESTLLGFFPAPDVTQVPPLDREIQIENNISAGPIQGTVNFDGFAYDAKMAI